MTIDEAIAHCFEVAERYETQEGCQECAADHRQLAEWLTDYEGLRAEMIDLRLYIQMLEEYREKAKRLLKAAVEDFNSVGRTLGSNDILCMKYIACKGCPFDVENCNKWRYADEALKLIES